VLLHLIYSITALCILNASQVLQVPLDLPGPQGVIVVQWTPSLTHPPIFNYFMNASGRVVLRNTYITYSQPVIELTIGYGAHSCRSRPVTYAASQTCQIFAFWRHVGMMFEMGIYLDGRLVGHTWEPSKPYGSWSGMTYIGARDPVGVLDPTFPGCCHIDGRMDICVMR